MIWQLSHRADPKAVPIADRHYNRQKIGSPQFVPPGRCMVLATPAYNALWVTSFPFAQYVKHAWAGAYVNSMFRNESPVLSSKMIREALEWTRWFWSVTESWRKTPEPEQGMVSFIDPKHVRRKRDWGRCYRKAGFLPVGQTKGGLYALQIKLCDMPEATKNPALGGEAEGK